MGLSKNTLDRSDISTYPIKLKYSASYASSSAINYGITLNRGINGTFDENGNQFLVYKLAQQLYYNSYLTGSLNNSASIWNDNLQSTAASGTFDNDFRYFPISSGDQITVMAIPRTVFGENISRKSVVISGTTYNLIDDGNGNIIDTDNNNVHVGNVLYNQGIIVVTNQDYEYALIDTPIPTTTTTSTTTSTTTVPTTTTTTTSTTTTTTTAAPTTTTSTTTTTTTAAPTTTTSTTTTTTTAAPTTTTSTTTTTTTEATTSTTTTTTTEAPTTTTSTTTTTTTEAQAQINVYARQIAPTYNLDFHYSTDGGSTWNFAGGSALTTSCTQVLTITVAQGTDLRVRIGSDSNINTVYTSNRSADANCPTWDSGTSVCEWVLLTNIANRDYAFTANVEESGACGTTTTTSTTTTTTTEAPTTTTSTTTTSTTEAPTTTTSTTTTSTTEATTSTTTTTTTEAPTTTTSTTTTTTTVAQVTISLYGTQEGITNPNLDFHYSTDGGSTWNFVGAPFVNAGSCNLVTNLTVDQGSSLSLRVGSDSVLSTVYTSNRDNSTCPAYNFGTAVCEWPALTNINRSYYFTVDVEQTGTCNPSTTTTTTIAP